MDPLHQTPPGARFVIPNHLTLSGRGDLQTFSGGKGHISPSTRYLNFPGGRVRNFAGKGGRAFKLWGSTLYPGRTLWGTHRPRLLKRLVEESGPGGTHGGFLMREMFSGFPVFCFPGAWMWFPCGSRVHGQECFWVCTQQANKMNWIFQAWTFQLSFCCLLDAHFSVLCLVRV